MGMNTSTCNLRPAEEGFLQALLWEEGHLLNGPATRAAAERGLSLIRCLEPANRLSPNLHGEALNRLRESACPTAEWPWGERSGAEVLRLLWDRLAEAGACPRVVDPPLASRLQHGHGGSKGGK
jgi:hypothetical protein